MTGTLDWRGPAVSAKMLQAQFFGLNKTLAQAVEHAKRNHAWQNRTGTLEGSIAIAEFAQRHGTGISGLWGSKDVRYAMIHELGGRIVAKNAPALMFEVNGQFVRTQSVTIPARPYLRPAADATYPNLAANIREGFAAL